MLDDSAVLFRRICGFDKSFALLLIQQLPLLGLDISPVANARITENQTAVFIFDIRAWVYSLQSTAS